MDTALKVLQTMKDFKDQVSNHSVKFAVGSDLEIDSDGIKICGMRVSDKASAGLLETMQVKKGFIKKVGPELTSWDEIKDALYTIFEGKTLAMHVDKNVIMKIKTVNQPYSDAMYEEATELLSQAVSNIDDRKVVLSKTLFGAGELSLQFVNDNEIAMFPGDAWKTGQIVTIDPFGIKLEPYMERQICTNGAVGISRTSEYNILHGKTHEANVLFAKKVGLTERKTVEELREGIEHAMKYNASVREFYRFRKYFEENCAESAEVQRALGKGQVFDDTKLLDTYGESLTAYSDRWLSTADSGVNAYDLINSATYIASRPVEYGITASAALGVQRMAAKSLMSNVDMMHVAPRMF